MNEDGKPRLSVVGAVVVAMGCWAPVVSAAEPTAEPEPTQAPRVSPRPPRASPAPGLPSVAPPTADPVHEIYFRPRHIGVFSMAIVTGLATSLPRLNPREASWTTPGSFDRKAREALRAAAPSGESNKGMAITSDVVAFGVVPAVVLGAELAWAFKAGHTGRSRAKFILQDFAVMGEALGFSVAAVSILKISTARRRPFARAGDLQSPPVSTPYHLAFDQNSSFPSGHSAFAFAFAVSGATLASMRRYPRWRLAWLGLIPAASVPLLRVSADKHYLSDTLVGSAIGIAIGAAVPLLIHNPRLRTRGAHWGLSPFHKGAQVSVRW